MGFLREHRGFRRLLVSQAVSLFGDWLSFVAISLLALHKGEGALALALVLVAHTLPSALAQPIAGVLSDRFDRIRLMVVSNTLQSALTVGMAIAASAGSMVAVQLLLVLRTAAAAIVMTARQAALPSLVPAKELNRANAIMSMTWSVMFALGMALGGALAMLGPLVALLIDASTFIVAIAFLWGLPVIRADKREEGALAGGSLIGGAFRAMARDLRESISVAKQDGALSRAVLSKFPLSLAGGSAWVLLNLVAEDPRFIGAGGLGLGLLHSTRGIGTGIGPWWTARVVARGRLGDEQGRDLAAALALISMGAFALLAHVDPSWWPLVLLAVFSWGWGSGTNWVLSTAAIQRIADNSVLGRISSLDLFLATTGLGTGALLGALAVDATGRMVAAGATAVVLGCLSWFAARRLSARARPHEAVAELEPAVAD